MRPIIAVPSHLVVGAASLVLVLAASASRAGDAVPAADPTRGDAVGVHASLQYAFGYGNDGSLIPVVSVGGGAGLGSTPEGQHFLFLHYRVGAGATSEPKTREDLARSLLLPGGLAFTVGAAHGSSSGGRTRIVSPDVSIEARVVPWHSDTTALRVGISGGILFSSSQVFDASIRLTRALNALGDRDRDRVLAASDSPDLWSSDVAATAGLHSRRYDLGFFGAFGAYLFDSKFHVPPGGRHVFSLGVRKGFG